jgi:hypothetical protein
VKVKLVPTTLAEGSGFPSVATQVGAEGIPVLSVISWRKIRLLAVTVVVLTV